MDVDESRFSEDYGQLKRAVQDLDRRLASLIIQVGLRTEKEWLGLGCMQGAH